MFPLCETEDEEDDTTDDVLKCRRDRDRKQRNIKNNTEEEWEKVVQIFRENTRKIENLERKFRKKKQFRFGRLVQPLSVDVLALT